MSRSSARRGQVEPLAAIAAVLALAVGLSIYADALEDARPAGGDRNLPERVLDRVRDRVAPRGVVTPRRLSRAGPVAPDGYRLNVTLETPERQWTAGPPVSGDARNVSGRVSVDLGGGRVVPARLTVGVWS